MRGLQQIERQNGTKWKYWTQYWCKTKRKRSEIWQKSMLFSSFFSL